jgi:transcriptional regulator with XRE-family HTH domain
MPRGAKSHGAKGFGERLYWARLQRAADLRRQVNQTEVGAAVGVTQTTVARWERGEKEPTLERIERLAAFFQLAPEWLAFGRGEPGVGTAATPPPKQSAAGPPVSDHAEPIERAGARGRRHRGT